MKQTLIWLSQGFVTALRTHLNQGPRANLQPALGQGHHAVALGVETLELARIHERALAKLELLEAEDDRVRHAGRESYFRRSCCFCGSPALMKVKGCS